MFLVVSEETVIVFGVRGKYKQRITNENDTLLVKKILLLKYPENTAGKVFELNNICSTIYTDNPDPE